MTNLSSVIPERRASIGKDNSICSNRHQFRKLLLYPTELRGPSALSIIHLARTLHLFSPHFNHVSPIFINWVGKSKGFFSDLF
jgi:hypothetical protein